MKQVEDNFSKYLTQCVTVRLMFALIIYFMHRWTFVRYASAGIAIVFSSGFVYKISKNANLNSNRSTLWERFTTANPHERGFFGGIVWWHNLRYMHAVLWAIVAALLIVDNDCMYVSDTFQESHLAGALVAIDVIPGILLRASIRNSNSNNSQKTENSETLDLAAGESIDVRVLMFRF